jgi:uroporphyrinogen III methyltransferase/synthase
MTVHLVGAGPGDPGLITVRGLELVRSCDALVYDRLVSPELVAEAPPHALRIGRDGLEQPLVDDLLVELGGAGLDVVRLKGGDPFVFGRGGEEVQVLTEAGIPVDVVPGVSSIAAVPAAAGIPVTHRGVSSTVTIASGSGRGGAPPDLDALARAPGTLVLFMALAALPRIAAQLIAGGKDPGTPAAVISRGTLPGQRVVVAPLAVLPHAAAGLAAPALVVVGEVVALAAAPSAAGAAAA